MNSREWKPPGVWLKRSELYLIVGAGAVLAVLVGALSGESPDAWESAVQDSQYESAPEPQAWSQVTEPPAQDGAFVQDSAASQSAPASTSASWQLAPRDNEALASGFSVAQGWSEITVQNGANPYVDVNGELGYEYLVLARAAQGCDVDAVLTEDIRDEQPSSDAGVSFTLQQAGLIRVQLPVHSNTSSCVVGVGVYRRFI